MNQEREKRYLRIQSYIMIMWIIIGMIFFAEKVWGCTATYMSEYTSGMHRVCIYNHMGSNVAFTYPLVSTCPLTVEITHG